MSSSSFDKIANYIWPGAGYIHRSSDGASGGIATMWNLKTMKGYEIRKEKNFVITHFQCNRHNWNMINIYAPNSRVGRKEMYDNLVKLTDTRLQDQWMCMGDFNTPLYHSEKRGGNRECQESLLDLDDFMRKLDLMDVELRGNPYTWTNNRKDEDLIQVKLDRLLLSGNWNNMGNSHLESLTRTVSDHSPILFHLKEVSKGGRSPFRYEIMWESHPEFKDKIEEWWNIRIDGTAMFRLTQKLDNIRRNVGGWAKDSFGDIFKSKREVEDKLKEFQSDIANGNNLEENIKQEENYRRRWKEIMQREEIFWKQRSRIQWLKEGDKNTSFFHRSASIHKRRNNISKLTDEGGEVIKEQDEMGKKVVEHFSKAIRKDNFTGNPGIRRSLIYSIPRNINDEDNDVILDQITEEEVKKAVFSMKAYKAPGPDGFPPAFFQHFWEVIKNEVIWATRDFFRTGKILRRINKTFIALVPKNPDPLNLNDFRPISLCNTIYKVVAKVLVNRLKPFLGKIIGSPQKGFVPGRQILDAAITTHEVIHSMEKSREPGMAFKLDISKAYDKVNWDFL